MTQQVFHGPNEGYILELYERYRQDPASVDAQTRTFFEHWTPPEPAAPSSPATGVVSSVVTEKAVGTANLAQAIREYGHLAAQLDPLGSTPIGDPSLKTETHGLTDEDLRHLPASVIGGPIAEKATDGLDAINQLRAVYSTRIGYDYDHIRDPEERAWLRQAAESRQFSTAVKPLDALELLKRLTQIEAFEQFLNKAFPGKHRFSIEGLDMMVPILDVVIDEAAKTGVRSVMMGMAHRGRLNVLAHILNKPYVQMLAEFKDPVVGRKFGEDLGWTGDVKYHSGAINTIQEDGTIDVIVTMAPNPSHLEAVNPVVEGMARAVADNVEKAGLPTLDPHAIIPLLIHGDAAFPGQGIVAETLNMSRLPGYWTGGTLHIISNNQLGFTTDPTDSRSTIYASDLAKGFKIPIVHVNADDPEACIEVARLAVAYQAKFERDFLIDLIGYRRYGHNEGDEPAYTQPVMYNLVRKHPTVRKQWADVVVQRGLITQEEADNNLQKGIDDLYDILNKLKAEDDLQEPKPELAPPKTAAHVDTRISLERLVELNRALAAAPEGFKFHPTLAKARQRRQAAVNENDVDAVNIDWAAGEELAFASILADGIPIRLTGQDAERGTYTQRHAVFHDVESGEQFVPLHSIPQAKASYEIRNSPLSENAAIGFEYGYNVQSITRLVLWEAQYGDFINGAQTILDEYVTSARAKFGQEPSLVLLLPHGYEGAGPDHSSGRLERFLQSAAQINMRVAYPTSAAQYFHLLRRQALLLATDPLPLVVMTPKSLLRNPLVASSLKQLAEGQWLPVIDDARAKQNASAVTTLLMCSGKVYIDLISSEFREDSKDIAIIRLEQLYPFPSQEITALLNRYSSVRDVLWVQEEPENMGAWEFARPLLQELLPKRIPLRYVGRARSSSPAEGSAAWHAANQKALIKRAFGKPIGRETIEVSDIIRER
jgi:2-oxoglutarate dehydrogenase E1 component